MIDIRLSDNLELMAEMQDNTVDLIYCDILYGTGKDFGDYVDLRPIKEDIENHYIPRIKEMYRVLKPTGSIYLQMDARINHWLRCILDDIFGYDNFKNEIIWYYKKWSANTKKFLSTHDNILFYTKSNKHIFNVQYQEHSENTKNRRKNKLTRVEKGVKIEVPFNHKGVPMHDVFVGLPYLPPSCNERKKVGYKTQKPKALIERIIKASSNEGDLVADFYAGSFTTAEVCKDLNRNFIGCDISEKAVQIGHARVSALF